jgi:DNA processing protein
VSELQQPPARADTLGMTLLYAHQLGLRSFTQQVGELDGPLPGSPRLAVVGSRAAHARVLRVIGPLIELAGARGWSLISGGALGIDGAAHRAALAHGLLQLVVLPCGRDRPYPPNHVGLFEQLRASGNAGLLYAQGAGVEPARGMFASRNAIVVGLADALIVAEAGLRSGSRATGEQALARRVPVAALAGSPGCGALIGAGATALPAPLHDDAPPHALLEAAAAWLDGVSGGAAPALAEPGAAWPDHLRWLARALADAGPAGATLDALGDPIRASVAMCEAELLGLVCEAAAGRFVAVG